ncbi:hypothetical protein [Nocardia thraciensis]
MRTATDAADRRPALSPAVPGHAEGDLDQAKLQALLAAAIEELYTDDIWLVVNELREEALVSRIAHHLANMVEQPGRNIHVDVEYNRQNNRNEPPDPKRDDRDKLVTPDLIVHARGTNNANLLAIEARRHVPWGTELECRLPA